MSNNSRLMWNVSWTRVKQTQSCVTPVEHVCHACLVHVNESISPLAIPQTMKLLEGSWNAFSSLFPFIFRSFSCFSFFSDVIAGTLKTHYQRLSELADLKLPVKYPRTPGHRPEPQDNPLNAWWVVHSPFPSPPAGHAPCSPYLLSQERRDKIYIILLIFLVQAFPNSPWTTPRKYSQLFLKRTPSGPKLLSGLERCPL